MQAQLRRLPSLPAVVLFTVPSVVRSDAKHVRAWQLGKREKVQVIVLVEVKDADGPLCEINSLGRERDRNGGDGALR